MQAEAYGASLAQLPPELLRNIWLRLRVFSSAPPDDQHALRCTCKAIRDASNSWIDSIQMFPGCILPVNPEEQAPHGSSALSQLSRFPRAAALHKMMWSCNFHVDAEDEHMPEEAFQRMATQQAQDLLAAFLMQGQRRLSSLHTFIFSAKDFSFADADALVDACPQLQHLEISKAFVTGPAFAPLRRMRSLSSLALNCVSTLPQHKAIIMSCLSSLTALTKLKVVPDHDEEADAATDVASPALLPCLASLSQLRDLRFEVATEAADAVGEALVQHISGVQHLTRLQAWDCKLPSNCPPLACSPNLAELVMIGQTLDTRLIKLFAAMPRLRKVMVNSMQPDCDLSQLPCNWEQLVVENCMSLQQLLWLPRGIQRLSDGGTTDWQLEKGVSLDSACRVLREAGLLLAEKPAWWRHRRLHVSLAAEPVTAAAAGETTGEGATHQSAWPGLFQELAPLQEYVRHIAIGQDCRLCADTANQGAHCLPKLYRLIVDPRAPGFDSFVEALGSKAWLGLLAMSGSCAADAQLPEGVIAALRQMAVQRSAAGHSLVVWTNQWLSDLQKGSLQAAAQHCKPGCRFLFG